MIHLSSTPTPTTPTIALPTTLLTPPSISSPAEGEFVDSVAKSLKTLERCYKKLQEQEEIIMGLRAEVDVLRQENYELRSLPDAPDYFKAKERFLGMSQTETS